MESYLIASSEFSEDKKNNNKILFLSVNEQRSTWSWGPIYRYVESIGGGGGVIQLHEMFKD